MTHPFRRPEVFMLTIPQRTSPLTNENVKQEVTVLIDQMNAQVVETQQKLKSPQALDRKGSPAYDKYRSLVLSKMKQDVAKLISAKDFDERIRELKGRMILKSEQLTATEKLIKAQRFQEIRDDIRRNNVAKNELLNTFLDDCRTGLSTDYVEAIFSWPGNFRPISDEVLEEGKKLLGDMANPEVAADLKNLKLGISVVEDFRRTIHEVN